MKSRYIKPDIRRYSISVNTHLLTGSRTPGVQHGSATGDDYIEGEPSYSKDNGIWFFMSNDADSEE